MITLSHRFNQIVKKNKGGIFIKQGLKFNLFYDNDKEELENLLIEATINYLKNKKRNRLTFWLKRVIINIDQYYISNN